MTTVISALLVAIEDTDGAAEAAWKYVLIASAGLGIALLGTIFAYYAGAQVLGQSYDLAFAPAAGGRPAAAHAGAAGLRARRARLRHQDGPVPGAHLAARRAFRGADAGVGAAVRVAARGQLLRHPALLPGRGGALGPRFPRDVLLVFGVASLLLAALYLFGQRDSSGCWPTPAWSTWASWPSGSASARRSRWPGCCCMSWRTRRPRATRSWAPGCWCTSSAPNGSRVTGGLDLLPWSGPLFLLAILALGAMPPFGIFRSEFEIVEGGFGVTQSRAAVLIVA